MGEEKKNKPNKPETNPGNNAKTLSPEILTGLGRGPGKSIFK